MNMGRSFRSAFVLVVCFCVGICLGQKCDHMQTLLFLRVQKTGSSTMLRWLKAYKMGHQDSTLFSDVGGCKPVTLDPVDVLVDHPDLAECPASFSHDFSACQAKVNVHRQSSGHSQYWQYNESAAKTVDPNSKGVSPGQRQAFYNGKSHYIHDMVTLRDPGDWFYSMFRYKDGLEAKAEVSGKKNWATFKEATGVSITTVDFGGYVEGSYYMWNTFARALAGDFGGQGINIVKVAMNKGRSDMLNELNDVKVNEVDTSDATINRSPILKAAVNRLKSFTFFAVKDRYKDSFDLFEFTFCTKSSRNSGFAHTKEQIVNFASGRTLANNQSRKKIFSEFQHVLDDKLRIDYLFYKIGLEIFDERVARMRDLQSRGISCSLYGSKCGVKCPY